MSRVHAQHERVTITVHGEPAAVLIAPEDPEAMDETTVARLISSDAELARGEIVSADELARAMANRGR